MKKAILVALTSIWMLMAGCTTWTSTTSLFDKEWEIEQLIQAHNNVRLENNQYLLLPNQQLMTAAQKHADWMAKQDRLTHFGEGKSRPSHRVSQEGYRYLAVAENIASGQNNVAEVMSSWMKSTGHRTNLLGNYINIGVGVAASRNGRLYWVAVFAIPKK